jgi:hypothetical protein
MRIDGYSFGTIRIDGRTYDHDLILEGGAIRRRKKGPSKRFRVTYGHTPLSVEEDIPWTCRRLVIGTGASGSLPVMDQVEQEARRREVDLIVVPTSRAVELLGDDTEETNAILHLTC